MKRIFALILLLCVIYISCSCFSFTPTGNESASGSENASENETGSGTEPSETEAETEPEKKELDEQFIIGTWAVDHADIDFSKYIEKISGTEQNDALLLLYGEDYLKEIALGSFEMISFEFFDDGTGKCYADVEGYKDMQKRSLEKASEALDSIELEKMLENMGYSGSELETLIQYYNESGVDWKEYYRNAFEAEIEEIEDMTPDQVAIDLKGLIDGDRVIVESFTTEIKDGKLSMYDKHDECIMVFERDGDCLKIDEYSFKMKSSDDDLLSMFSDGLILKRK